MNNFKRVTLNPMKPTILQCRMMCGLLNNTFHDDTINNSLDYIKQLEIVNNKGRYTLNANKLDSKTLKVIKSKTKRKRVFDNSTIEELENGLNLAEPGWLQTKIASPLGILPVFKQVLGAVNPSSLVDTEVGKSTLALGMANETGKSLADIAVSFVGQKGKSPFTIDDNGMAKLIDKQGRTIDKAWGDVFQNPKAVARYLTKDQKDYIKECRNST